MTRITAVWTLSLLLISSGLSAQTVTFCIVGLEGSAAYELEGHVFAPDRVSDPIVIQLSSDRGVSVLNWGPGDCSLLAEAIVCASGDTVETYVVTDDGVVYYTKISLNPIFQGIKALVGRVGDCE